ncbi:MAG: Asp-tRNA(Asn)/Glu-tRNA(Gln) amidotransferase GatCAB subunit C [Planctomycetota bacterium]|nr:MAG: Asp-tRNA(Asn)/Glu-tRNA(Gln) amidotransferase GatCAB subunit C [Planctomycetota bacterium]
MENDAFDNVEKLSRLKFSENEKNTYQKSFNNILQYVEQLAEINTDGIEPLIQVSEIYNVFREDLPINSIGVDAALQNAPTKEGSAFKVPKVIK